PSFVVNGAAARFLFASEGGTISAWNGSLGTTASVVATSPNGGIYKGLAIDSETAGTRIYAADFHNKQVDVYDGTFALVTPTGAFTDPDLPEGYSPFGIQTLNGEV